MLTYADVCRHDALSKEYMAEKKKAVLSLLALLVKKCKY